MQEPIARNDRQRNIWRSGWFVLAAALAIGFALYMFLWEMRLPTEIDLQIHASYSVDFDFTDLHSITSRIAYPLWHVLVAILYQLGLPIDWSAAIITTFFRAVTFVFTYRLLNRISGGKLKTFWLAVCGLLVFIVTGVNLPNDTGLSVYRFVNGSPNVWHNPTQQAVISTMMICVPFLVWCGECFEQKLPESGDATMLPWWQVFMLAFLLGLNLMCKPTVMQAFLPAAFLMYLVELCRRPRNWRYFAQIVLAFIPAVICFLVQYLYYTGVVVPYTSGVDFGATAQTLWEAFRTMLMMNAFPIAALICCYRKGLFKDRLFVLAVLMVLISMLEVAFFRETGERAGHGNFGWAAMSSSYFFWVVMLGKYAASLKEMWKTAPLWRKALFVIAAAVLLWHLVSSVGYYVFMLSTGNAF
ncbi:MAG: hypothetical protein E7323_00570 [Clostridiales bacterium]|nr:hypothetical protein [Clostridiales bacterium]